MVILDSGRKQPANLKMSDVVRSSYAATHAPKCATFLDTLISKETMKQATCAIYDVLLKVYGFLIIYSLGLLETFRQYVWLYRYRTGQWSIPGGIDGYARGRRVLITGGVGAIGLQAARSLLNFDCDLVVVDKVPSDEADQRLATLGIAKTKVSYYEVDLVDFNAVKKLATRIVDDKLIPDVLLFNAATMHAPYMLVNGTEANSTPCESQLAISYLSHVLLLSELSPHLDRSRQPRIVFNSSVCHKSNYVNLEDLNGMEAYSAHLWYSQSKLCQVALVRLLASRNANFKKYGSLHFTAVHPGIVHSDLYEHVSIQHLTRLICIMTPAEGAVCPVHACLSPVVKSGDYLEFCEPVVPSTNACDTEIQEKLFSLTTHILKSYTDVATLY